MSSANPAIEDIRGVNGALVRVTCDAQATGEVQTEAYTNDILEIDWYYPNTPDFIVSAVEGESDEVNVQFNDARIVLPSDDRAGGTAVAGFFSLHASGKFSIALRIELQDGAGTTRTHSVRVRLQVR